MNSEGFFSRIIRSIARSLAPVDDEEVLLGGRADRIAEGGQTEWVFDIDPDALFFEGIAALGDGEYDLAVDTLRRIEYPEDGTFALEEYYVALSQAFMGIGDFHAAMAASFEYALAAPGPDNVHLLSPRLKLLAGVAAYYAGDDETSLAALSGYLQSVSLADAAPEAVVLQSRLLAESGRESEADSLLQRARSLSPGVEWDSILP